MSDRVTVVSGRELVQHMGPVVGESPFRSHLGPLPRDSAPELNLRGGVQVQSGEWRDALNFIIFPIV